ncbi:hypothetical protein SARC_00151 [Sphaeroforma arctica JP610]|uniref:HECT-type E3 ubiquitin transferase n=1 Tax=Sphaeroforma arctica JP610 TaxID=667725 RepID=A0A0L0GFC5_9EUKA|nr:hypothetical protein SARC_00151 [Sphaeroforma arctica JP610]KNC87717.1 hypothetical protein SARC_00151 [Sphaeroforma arctica JP610]|eukprot:XP_014161619.1 hypothetical protein SARC_00151 [Sphaeroforma arctica JP610]
MLNPNYCLFEYANENHTTLKINSNSSINPEHLSYFHFIGRVVGMAVFHGKFIDCGFTLPFYKKMLRKPLTLQDMEAVDPEYYQSLTWLLEHDIDELYLGMTFAVNYDAFGERRTHDLKVGRTSYVCAYSTPVYVWICELPLWLCVLFVCVHLLISAVSTPSHSLDYTSLSKRCYLICGVQEIDVDDWERNTIYRSFTPNAKQVRWFWQFVRASGSETRARVLQFVTGTCRVPMDGFKGLQGSNDLQLFCIEKVGTEGWLPRAHTCFNRLDLPPYKSYQQLCDKITIAIEETEGFGQE